MIIRQSILAMLLKMEHHDPLMYREILIRGRPGRWAVEVLKGDMSIGVVRSASIEDALSAGLRLDLDNAAKPGAATQLPPAQMGGMAQRWGTPRPTTGGDLFGPLP